MEAMTEVWINLIHCQKVKNGKYINIFDSIFWCNEKIRQQHLTYWIYSAHVTYWMFFFFKFSTVLQFTVDSCYSKKKKSNWNGIRSNRRLFPYCAKLNLPRWLRWGEEPKKGCCGVEGVCCKRVLPGHTDTSYPTRYEYVIISPVCVRYAPVG